jgi:mRNA interferase MazF
VIVIPCTTRHRGLPSHVELEPRDSGLDEVSYAKCEDVKSISERRLVAKLGFAHEEAIHEMTRALGFLLGM